MLHILDRHLPCDWSTKSTNTSDYEKIEITSFSSVYRVLSSKVSGSFNKGVRRIEKVENPFLYGHFLLKKAEYETRGSASVVELFHDTAGYNVDSILRTNLDWRVARRVKYGEGVSFSNSPAYANKESSRSNGTDRAMIIADVLVGMKFVTYSSVEIPSDCYDTAVGNNSQVYVKFDDNEFYPKYVVYYTSEERVYRRRGFW